MQTVETGLQDLLSRLADAREGYREGATLAESTVVVAVMGALEHVHGQHMQQLGEAMALRGMDPGDPGSAMALVHKTILNIRSLLSGLDDSVIPGLVDGEGRIVAAYDDVIADVGGTDDTLLSLLTTQRATLVRRTTDLERMERSVQS